MSIENDNPQCGDKVRIKAGLHRGVRGVVAEVGRGELRIDLDTGMVAVVTSDDVTNFSLAARRAWRAMPSRSVGRPRMLREPKKQVSLRIDAATWQGLGLAVERGLIPNREKAINEWLREHLDHLLQDGK